MGAYKRDVVPEIKMGAYIHGVLILCGCLSRFYSILVALSLVQCFTAIHKLMRICPRKQVTHKVAM